MSPEGHKDQNSNLNKPAIYIDLSTEDVRFFRSFAEAGKHFNAKSHHTFGQVLRGRGSYLNQVVLRLHDFIRISEDELADLLDHARARRHRGFRPLKTNAKRTIT